MFYQWSVGGKNCKELSGLSFLLHRVLVVLRGFSLIVVRGLCSWWYTGCLVEVYGLSCPVACGILASQPGTEPTPAASEGRFFITGRPGKSLSGHSYTLYSMSSF